MTVDVEMVSIRAQYSLLFFGHPITINLYIQIVTAPSYKPQIRLNKYSAYLKLTTFLAETQFTAFISTPALTFTGRKLHLL
jgi:nitrogen fixation protein FixH